MRREYNVIDKEPLPPFAENLVFWAPLTEGDLTDHISGKNLTQTNGTVTWDAAVGAYKFVGPNRRQLGIHIAEWSGLSLGLDVTNLEFTIVFEIYKFSNELTTPAHLGGRTFATNLAIGADANVWNKFCTALERYNGVAHHYSHQYLNGVDKLTFDRGTSPILGNVNTNVKVECNDNNDSRTYYMRNVRIYNRALTAEEVAQL